MEIVGKNVLIIIIFKITVLCTCGIETSEYLCDVHNSHTAHCMNLQSLNFLLCGNLLLAAAVPDNGHGQTMATNIGIT